MTIFKIYLPAWAKYEASLAKHKNWNQGETLKGGKVAWVCPELKIISLPAPLILLSNNLHLVC